MTDDDLDAAPERGRAFYGRRKGKRLRPGQEERIAALGTVRDKLQGALSRCSAGACGARARRA